MTKFLHITVHWLDDRYHGLLGRDGPPEWPPSPYRLFQALVAGTARAGKLDKLGDCLRTLESLDAPLIIAPRSRPGRVVTHFVPNNDGDKKPDRQDRLTAKTFRPTIMLGSPEVRYVWRVDSQITWVEGVIEAARCVTCLGLGVDMACGDAGLLEDAELAQITGVRWLPHPALLRDDGVLRTPKVGSLDDLKCCHGSALARIEPGQPLRTVRQPRVFNAVAYTSPERPIGRPFEVFALRNAAGEFAREPQAQLIHVAGMVRHAAIKAMDVTEGFPPPGIADAAAWVESFVAGHHKGNAGHAQFSYVPLPSIGHEHADCDIRRVMIVAPCGEEAHLAHLAEQLDGRPLRREGGGAAPILERLGRRDGVVRAYVGTAAAWATVTPIILPGHDDHKPAKTKKLLETALRQSGIDQRCEVTWGAVANFRNCLSAYTHDRHRRPIGYFRPDHLTGLTGVHARLTFNQPVAGPLIIGAGRHYGLGALAAVDAE